MCDQIKMPHLAPVKLWWILLKDVSALIDSFASNVNYGVRQGFCLHWSNLLPSHSVNGRTGCWVFSSETWNPTIFNIIWHRGWKCPLIHFQKLFWKKVFHTLKLVREFKFHIWITISGCKSVKKSQTFLKKATNWT